MLTVCGLVAALSLTETVPLLAPIAEGLNLMLIVRLAPEFKVAPPSSG
jgi:hypothetical protein